MQGERQKKSEDPTITRTTGTDDPHERNKADPSARDMSDPKEVWKDGETTPSRVRASRSGGDRVADAGDIGGGQPSPYSTETQADAIAGRKAGGKDRSGAEKPKQ